MDALEILKNNILIAEFMNARFKTDGVYQFKVNEQEWAAQGLKYDWSWDWLMPVLEKIEQDRAVSFTYNNWNNDGHYQIYIHYCFDMKENRERKLIIEKVGNDKLNLVYEAVVDYCKWKLVPAQHKF